MIKAVGRRNVHHSPTLEKRTRQKTKQNKTKQGFTDQHHGKQKRMKQIHHKHNALINTCRGGAFVIYPPCQSPLFKSSLVERSASQNLPVIHTHPYSYHRDWLSSGLSDWSEFFT